MLDGEAFGLGTERSTFARSACICYQGHRERHTTCPESSPAYPTRGPLSARSRNGVHISDHRLTALIHMHMLDADSLRIAVPQTP